MTAAGTVTNRNNSRIGRYEWLELVVRSDLSATLKLVAHTLAFHADYATGENIFPGHDALQAETSLGRTALKSAIANLIALALIERVSSGKSHGRGGGAQAAVYRLTNPGDAFLEHLNEGREATIIGGNQGHEATTITRNEGHEAANEGHDVVNEGREVTPHPSSTPSLPLPPTPQPSPQLEERRQGREENLILQDLSAADLDREEAQAVLDYARRDPDTIHLRKRLQQPAYLAWCRQAIKASRVTAFSAGLKCEDHPTEVAANCRSCMADVKVGDRDRQYIGRRQPEAVSA